MNCINNERRALFTKLYYFVMNSDIKYKTFLYEKIHFEDDMKLQARMAKDISFFLRNHLDYFLGFDKVIIYYDNGQRQITRMLNAVLATELTEFEMRKVSPVNYCLFHSRNDLRKDFLKKIKNKEFDESPAENL